MYIALGMAALLAGCRCEPPDPTRDDKPTEGKILMLADVDAKPAIDKQLEIFHAFYRKAEITVRYLDEAAMLKALHNDSVRVVISTVEPGGEELAYYRERRITTPVVPLYHTAIALVVSPESGLHQLDVPTLKAMLEGRGPEGSRAIFAGAGSGIARQLIDSLGIATMQGSSLPDVHAVVAEVARNPKAVGFLPFEYISDLDDPRAVALRDSVRLLPVAPAAGATAVLPSQSTIGDRSYPLLRTVQALVTEGKTGLGTGFVSFVANKKGQRIILKLGLLPVRIPERNIEIVPE